MKKFTLFFILLLLLSAFFVFFYKVYLTQKNYFAKKVESISPSPVAISSEIEIPSKYLDYSKENYDLAILDKRPVVLFFTSNWCSLCQDQDTVNKTVFEGLTKEGITGFRIHILDSETTTTTDSLAKKFDVTKENSIVILDKNGAVYFKSIGNISLDSLKTKILEAR